MFDIAIIGAGPGGYVAALRAGQNGARVALIEKNELGGVCLNRGCIPTKAFIASAHAAFAVKKASEFGVRTTGKIEIDMQAVLARKNAIVETLRGGIEKLLKSCNVKLLKGDARFVSENEVEAGGEKIKAKNFIIATGSSWVELPALKIDGKNIVTSDEVLDFSRLPKSIAIVGGGVVGCEFACMLNTFGVQVTIIEAMPSILPMMEKGITRFLARSMKSDGIKILTETRVESAVVEEGRVFCRLSNGESMETSKLMVAAGRRPVFFDLGLDAAGVVLSERGFIKTDAYLRTSCPHIFAIGDCRGGRMLAHEASAEGVAAVDNILNGSSVEIETDFIPSPVFTFPEIGSVGFTSDELKEKGIVFKTRCKKGLSALRFPGVINSTATAPAPSFTFVDITLHVS